MTSSSGPMPPSDPSGAPPPGYGGAPESYGNAPAGYGNAPAGYGNAPGGAPHNGLGVGALIVGILALVTTVTFFGAFVGWLLGIIAVVLGFLGRSRAKKGEADNGGMALAGIITGAIAFVLSVIFVVIIVAFVWTFGSSTSNYLDCVSNANGNQAAINQCGSEFDN